MTIRVIAFDADDTLWHNESLFIDTRARFASLLGRYRDEGWVQRHLDEMEIQNLDRYGYGIKAFTLSMIETAVELSSRKISAEDIAEILGYGHQMLDTPVDLLDGVKGTLEALGEDYRLQVITKGDLFDQESKIAQSGLGELFEHIEIVSRKDRHTYERVIARAGVRHDEFMMVGNSMKSDIVPASEVGAIAVLIPYSTVWSHEDVEPRTAATVPYHELQDITELPSLLERLDT